MGLLSSLAGWAVAKGFELGERYVSAREAQNARARETASETAARHSAEDALWLKQLHGLAGQPLRENGDMWINERVEALLDHIAKGPKP